MAEENLPPPALPNSSMPEPVSADVAILDLTFVHAIPKACLCSLCNQLMKEPCHLTCCGTNYCKKCVERMRTQSLACVKCRSHSYSIDTDERDKNLESVILSQGVYCPLKSQGCSWSGKLGGLEDHLEWGVFNPGSTSECRYLPVPCPNECGLDMSRRNMEKHLKTQCKKRVKKCEFCKEEGVAEHIDTVHHDICVMRIISCPNGCKMPGIRQSKLSVHLEVECPLRTVPCIYASIGCTAQIKHKDSMSHNDSNIQEHFRLMSMKLDCMTSENEELRKMCQLVETTCSKLQEQYNFLFSLLESEKAAGPSVDPMVVDTKDESDEVSYFSIHNQQSVRRLLQQHPPIHHDRMAWLSSPSSDDGDAPPLPPRGLSMSNPVDDDRSPPPRASSSNYSDSSLAAGKRNQSESVSSASSHKDAVTVKLPPPIPARSDSLSGATLKEKARQAAKLVKVRRESSNSDVFLPTQSIAEYDTSSSRRNQSTESLEAFRGIAWSIGDTPPPTAPLARRNMSMPCLDHVEEHQRWESGSEDEIKGGGDDDFEEEAQVSFDAAANPCYVPNTPQEFI